MVLLLVLCTLTPSKNLAAVICSDIFDSTHDDKTSIQKQLLRSSAEALGLAIDFVPPSTSSFGPSIIKETNFQIRKKENQKMLKSLPNHITPEFERLVIDSVQPMSLSPGIFRIKISTDHGNIKYNDSIGSQYQKKIIHRYYVLYSKIANFVYELQGLEPKNPITGARMFGENLEILSNNSKVDLFLLFDEAVWKTQVRQLEKIWSQYLVNQDRSAFGELFQTNLAVLPFAGVTTVQSKDAQGEYYELKRYWKNAFEDPYDLLTIQNKNDFVLRHKLLESIIYELPPQSRLKIKSHTIIHTKAYGRLGFSKTNALIDKNYPDVQVDLLETTREIALEKIAKILKDSKADPSIQPDSSLDAPVTD